MVQTGAPDFQDFSNWTDSPLFSGAAGCSIVGTSAGFFNISQWAGIQCYVTNVTQAVIVRLVFYADVAKTIKVAERWFEVNTVTGSDSTFSAACFGTFVDVVVGAGVGNANALTLTVVGTNRIGPANASGQQASLFSQTSVVVGAGGSVTTPTNFVFTGPVHVCGFSNQVNGAVLLNAKTHAGGSVTIYQMLIPTASTFTFNSPVYLPPCPIDVVLTNFAGVGAQMTCYINPDAFRPQS